jgi:hypothetical protein
MEQLALAWRHMRRPATWPPTLELCLEHAVYGPIALPCLRALARRLGRASPTPGRMPQRAPRPLPEPPPVPARPAWRGPTFDARRAAANDRDDLDDDRNDA